MEMVVDGTDMDHLEAQEYYYLLKWLTQCQRNFRWRNFPTMDVAYKFGEGV